MREPKSRVGASGPELGPCAGGTRPERPQGPRSGAGPEGACSGFLHVRLGVGPGVENWRGWSSRGARGGGTKVEAGLQGSRAPKWAEPRCGWDGVA